MGQLHNFVIGLIVILAILILNGYGKGMVSAAAVLGGMIVGYVIAAIFGYINFRPSAKRHGLLFQGQWLSENWSST